MKRMFDVGPISVWVDEEGNYKCHLDGSYIITVSNTDGGAKDISIKVAKPITYYLRGNMTNWEAIEEYKLILDEETMSASLIVNLDEDDEFKVASFMPDWSYQFGADYTGEIVRHSVVSKNIKRPKGTYKITVSNVCSVNNCDLKIEPVVIQ